MWAGEKMYSVNDSQHETKVPPFLSPVLPVAVFATTLGCNPTIFPQKGNADYFEYQQNCCGRAPAGAPTATIPSKLPRLIAHKKRTFRLGAVRVEYM